MIAGYRFAPLFLAGLICCLVLGAFVDPVSGKIAQTGVLLTSAKPVDPAQLKTVAMIGGVDEETRMIVEDTLKSAGVPVFIGGSVVYAVQVYRRDYALAYKTLKADPRLADRWISYMDSSD
jgi:hypothetical protein